MQTKWYEKFRKGCEMYFMFQDFWNLVQNYWRMEDVDEYWDNLVMSISKFMKKYPTEFAKSLAFAFLNEKERQRREN